jgi:hypothetical protein
LAQYLRSAPTADGQTLLDHTLIVWLQEYGGISLGIHVSRDIGVVIVGNMPGFRSGQHLRLANAPMPQLHVTLARLLGVAPSAAFSGFSVINQLLQP